MYNDYEKIITVLTPTYNRIKCLKRCYYSLMKQTNNKFKWLIIDDGSTDDTASQVKKWIADGLIEIEYVYQKNHGKHVALNKGISLIASKLTFIVDSDDRLTENSIETIIEKWKIIQNKNLCGMSFLRGYNANKVIGKVFPYNEFIDNFINVRENMAVYGDKAEVWVTEILKKFPFPVFGEEKFLGEALIWWRMSKKYDMLFVNKIIYITEYLNGGLTKSGRKLRIRCPYGGMEHAKEALTNHFKLKVRIKNSWLYISYGFFAKKKIIDIIGESHQIFLILINLPFGYLLYKYWSYKYMRGN